MKRYLWLVVMSLAAILGTAGLIWGWYDVFSTGGLALAPLAPDDMVYYQIMSEPGACLQNATSVIAEGACRLRPLWLIGRALSFGHPGLGILVLTLLIWAGLFAAVGYGGRALAKRSGYDVAWTRFWLALLLVLSPLPLVMVTGYVFQVPELLLVSSSISGLPSFFSWFLYLVAVGGFYVYRENTRLWPVIGLILGFLTLCHPYYLPFMLVLFVIWLVQIWQVARRHIWQAAGLLAPMGAVGVYYVWLTLGNKFFQFHMHNNVLRHVPGMVWWLAVALGLVMAFLWAVWRQTSPKHRKLDPLLASWAVVAMAFQFIPELFERRMLLILSVPLVLLVISALACLPKARWSRVAVWSMLGANFLVFVPFALFKISTYAPQRYSETVATGSDQSFARQLATSANRPILLADQYASLRLLWLADIRIINSHPLESPDYFTWLNDFSILQTKTTACANFLHRYQQNHATGVVLDKLESAGAIKSLEGCGLHPGLSNNRWLLLSTNR